MGTQFGTNIITWYVIFPILLIVASCVIWFVVKLRVTLWKRVAFAVGSLFALIGFAVVVLGVYYQASTTFASSLKFYTYSTFAPDKRDPFETHSSDQPVLMMRDVGYSNGEVRLLHHPNPEVATIVYLFTPGKFITADLKNDVLTIPEVQIGNSPRIEHTSLWWALTKDPYKLNAYVK